MPRSSETAATWVQLAQALIARELVETDGLPERRAARALGLAPSAVSQYLSGRRLGRELAPLSADPRARAIARTAAERLAAGTVPDAERLSVVLEAARELASAVPVSGSRAPPRGSAKENVAESRALTRALRQRIGTEQSAVTECMRLAQKSRDELTRAVFRQIAADSLRHAEIVASIQTYLDRGIHRPLASGVTRDDLERLIARERDAEVDPWSGSGIPLRGVMAVLWESMESDERKHTVLLDAMLREGFADPAHEPRGRSRPRSGADPLQR